MIKQAILLCGGEGTRLRPYTYEMSKQMIPIQGHPLTEWNIIQFKKYGVTDFLINLHTKPEVMQSYLGDGSKWGVKITYNYEPELPGTAGSIKLFEKYTDDEFFVIYGDMLTLVDYGRMEKAWREKPADIIGMQRVQKAEDYADADVVELDTDGKFVAIRSKPHMAAYPNAYRMRGILIMKKKILSYIPKLPYYEIGKDLLPDIVGKGEKFYGYECSDYSKGIDTREKWDAVEEYLKKIDIHFDRWAHAS